MSETTAATLPIKRTLPGTFSYETEVEISPIAGVSIKGKRDLDNRGFQPGDKVLVQIILLEAASSEAQDVLVEVEEEESGRSIDAQDVAPLGTQLPSIDLPSATFEELFKILGKSTNELAHILGVKPASVKMYCSMNSASRAARAKMIEMIEIMAAPRAETA